MLDFGCSVKDGRSKHINFFSLLKSHQNDRRVMFIKKKKKTKNREGIMAAPFRAGEQR